MKNRIFQCLAMQTSPYFVWVNFLITIAQRNLEPLIRTMVIFLVFKLIDSPQSPKEALTPEITAFHAILCESHYLFANY